MIILSCINRPHNLACFANWFCSFYLFGLTCVCITIINLLHDTLDFFHVWSEISVLCLSSCSCSCLIGSLTSFRQEEHSHKIVVPTVRIAHWILWEYQQHEHFTASCVYCHIYQHLWNPVWISPKAFMWIPSIPMVQLSGDCFGVWGKSVHLDQWFQSWNG